MVSPSSTMSAAPHTIPPSSVSAEACPLPPQPSPALTPPPIAISATSSTWSLVDPSPIHSRASSISEWSVIEGPAATATLSGDEVLAWKLQEEEDRKIAVQLQREEELIGSPLSETVDIDREGGLGARRKGSAKQRRMRREYMAALLKEGLRSEPLDEGDDPMIPLPRPLATSERDYRPTVLARGVGEDEQPRMVTIDLRNQPRSKFSSTSGEYLARNPTSDFGRLVVGQYPAPLPPTLPPPYSSSSSYDTQQNTPLDDYLTVPPPPTASTSSLSLPYGSPPLPIPGTFTCSLCRQTLPWTTTTGSRNENCIPACSHVFCLGCARETISDQLGHSRRPKCPAESHRTSALVGLGPKIPFELGDEIGLSDEDVAEWRKWRSVDL